MDILKDKWCIKNTESVNPILRKWIKGTFETDYYEHTDNRHPNRYFHFPNYHDNKGFKQGQHFRDEVTGEYIELTLQEFIKLTIVQSSVPAEELTFQPLIY